MACAMCGSERVPDACKNPNGLGTVCRSCLTIERMEVEIASLRNAQSELARYFTSGNGVPVERATILAKDFWRITDTTPNA